MADNECVFYETDGVHEVVGYTLPNGKPVVCFAYVDEQGLTDDDLQAIEAWDRRTSGES